ncbi:MAG TPA: hypothetical protein VFS31_15845 [Chitinophagaceae bacterium]|nr:hypothetical protein [Chitinophagaceae bacterium]
MDEDFSVFTNRAVYARGEDDKHLLILFIDNDLSADKNESPYIVSIDPGLKKVVKTSSHLMIDTTGIDKTLLKNLAIHFLDYNVESLKVDTNGNVFIGLISTEKPDLIRFSSDKYKTAYYKEGWVRLRGNWYVRKE